jgi:hypothetical protein
MKLFLFSLLAAGLFTFQVQAQGYTVTLKTPSYQSGLAYLTYHMGKNLNIEDSAMVSNQGVALFKGNKRLPAGIYAIVFPGKRYTFDFFVSKEQEILIEADTLNLQNPKITGSKENNLFQEYQNSKELSFVFFQFVSDEQHRHR